jgi:hypothetical protein
LERILLAAFLLAGLADAGTYAVMGVESEANPIIVHLAGIDPVMPHLLKIGAALIALLVPKEPYPLARSLVFTWGAALWSIGAISNVATIL